MDIATNLFYNENTVHGGGILSAFWEWKILRKGRKETMRIGIKNLLKQGMFLLFLLFVLTACTSRNDMVLELEAQDNMQQSEMLPSDAAESLNEQNVSETEELPEDIFVHICGAVVNPGVYILSAGSRIFEGIEAAGGFSEDACEDFVNLAQTLQDGQRIVIPTEEEAEAAVQDGAYQEQWLPEETQRADGRININTASEQELSAISGIGAGKAAAIIQYRQENGSFSSVEDIMKVSGIKEGTYEKIKDKITVN